MLFHVFNLQRPLITDRNDAARFASVLVHSSKIHKLEQQAEAKSASEAAGYLLNGVIDLVFDRQRWQTLAVWEYAKNKNPKPDDVNKKPLDPLKVDAISGRFKHQKAVNC